jgi:hypothetical protein
MEKVIYANRTGDMNNSIYHRVNSIKGVVSTPSIERIIFETGEIELTTSNNELRICSKTYLQNGESAITHKIVKTLIPGYNPQMALNRAKNDILQRITDLEIGTRSERINQELVAYMRRSMLMEVRKTHQDFDYQLKNMGLEQERIGIAS